MKITPITRQVSSIFRKTNQYKPNSNQTKMTTLAGAAAGAAILAGVIGCGPAKSTHWTPFKAEKPQVFSNQIYNETDGYDPYEPNATTLGNQGYQAEQEIVEPASPELEGSSYGNVAPSAPRAGQQQILEDVTLDQYKEKYGEDPKAPLDGDDILLDAPEAEEPTDVKESDTKESTGEKQSSRQSGDKSLPVSYPNLKSAEPTVQPKRIPNQLPEPKGEPPRLNLKGGVIC